MDTDGAQTMSAMRDLAVHINDEVVSGHALELATCLAAQWGAQLTAVLVPEPVNAGVGLSAETAALRHQLAQAHHEALLAVGERLVATARQQHPVVIEQRLIDGEPVEVLLAHARTADLLVTSQRDPAGGGGLSTGQSARLIVGAACPVLTVPYIGWGAARADTTQQRYLRRVLVAWADTRESARAVRDALPLLHHASDVELVGLTTGGQADVASWQASLRRVADYLARHGVRASTVVLSQTEPSLSERMRRGWVPDVSVAEALQSHAADIQADLIVMGAYGHHRLWEWVLGGVTKTMLESMTVPVLMSH
jgi:nucleotide-binding universal stress UspA family protein